MATIDQANIRALQRDVEYLKDQNVRLKELLEDRLVRLPDDLNECPAFIVIEDSPAWEAVVRIAARSGGLKSGSLHPIRRAEFESFKTDVLALHLQPKKD